MNEEKLENLLYELGEETAEPARPELAEDIKRQIPHPLKSHRGGLDNINIVIDLRISKLAAAAIIIITMILLASVFNAGDTAGKGIYQDSMMVIKYYLGKGIKEDINKVARTKYEYLLQQGRDVTYYGDSAVSDDKGTVLIHWKLDDGSYKVVFGDLTEQTVSAEQLIKLQAQMLQNQEK